jgi:hypothetical protein
MVETIMNRTFRTAVVAFVLAIGFTGLIVAGPLEDGPLSNAATM